jgi:hypothetical protein
MDFYGVLFIEIGSPYHAFTLWPLKLKAMDDKTRPLKIYKARQDNHESRNLTFHMRWKG